MTILELAAALDARDTTDPYERGFEAAMNEKGVETNPFTRGTENSRQWINGWQDLENDWTEVQRDLAGTGSVFLDKEK